MLCSVRTMCIALLHEYMYACAYQTSIPSVREQNNACCQWYMRTCECVWAARWVCTRASQHVGACILFFPRYATSAGHWLVLVTFVGLLVIASAVTTIPPPHTLPYYPQTKHPSCTLSQLKTIEGGLPPLERGGKTYHWRAAAPIFFAFMLIATCTMARQDLTTGLVPSQHPCIQPHFTPTSSPPTPLYLIAISILAINSLSGAYRWALPQCSLRTARLSTSPTRLGKVYKRALVVLPSSPHQRAFVCGAYIGTAQVGVSLVSIFRSTLQTVYVALFQCMFV